MSDTTPDPSAWILETDEDSFDKDVFERSKQTLVVVDFWAAWCQPCRMLAPVLEKIANDYEGKFLLVKAETDRVPKAAGEFGVSSIPVVYGVVGGDVVDFFQGALPDQQIREWIDRLLGASRLIHARQTEEEKPAEAEAVYREILAESPNQIEIQVDLARVLVVQERFDESRELIDELERMGLLDAEAEKVKATLDLRSWGGTDLDTVRADAEAKPDDLPLQLSLAEALAANEQFQEAMEVCLSIVTRDKQGVGQQARDVMVDIFRVVPDEELVRTYRKKLSTTLY